MPEGWKPELVAFATTEPAYLDKTNATAIHAALAAPGDEMPKAVAEPLRAATAAFEEIGWPGGAGPFLETAAAILRREHPGWWIMAGSVLG